ncbi:hypothetical protein DNTS_017817 [Danionella cerebrum]|uniref:Peptidase S1 domain-containing protein n=1 Tax=Danionella cerebrum TaxID=2873325 RepID=A0A553R0C5_9TELE|nr:hypothetical protein DNTS_017817 [Danionella translucida]
MTSNIIFCAAGVILLSITGCMAQLDVCGSATLSTKIVGGANANNGSWPWQASINAASFGGFYCSGSLINNQWVLTQAQVFILVKASQLIVYLGRNSQKGPNPNEISRNVTKIIKHPNYISEENNVALLKLSSPVTFNDHIKPVCLAAAGSVFVEGTMGWVTGWGSIVTNEWNFPILPDLLQEVEAPVLNSADCQNAYGGANTDGLMCAGFFDGGKAPCVLYVSLETMEVRLSLSRVTNGFSPGLDIILMAVGNLSILLFISKCRVMRSGSVTTQTTVCLDSSYIPSLSPMEALPHFSHSHLP